MRKNRNQQIYNFIVTSLLVGVLSLLIFDDTYKEIEYLKDDVVNLHQNIEYKDSVINELEYRLNTLAIITNELIEQAPNWEARINQLKTLDYGN